jgi:TetR/AcrR family transcriptional regulator
MPPASAPRKAIIDAAHQLIEESGGSFTTQDLIKRAGVALQTFYRHFESKDRLLLAVITELIAENCEAFAGRAAGLDGPIERLRAYVTTALESLHTAGGSARFITSEHWRLQQLFPQEVAAATKPFADLVQKELETGNAAGVLTSADTERDAWLIMTVVLSVYHEFSFLPDDPRNATVAEDVWEFCLAAVGGRPVPARRGRRNLTRSRPPAP